MTFHVEVSEELSLAKLACESVIPFMYLYVLIQIRFLSEALVTAFHGASVGSLLSVDPEVVKEVVPLPEIFSAT